MSEKGLTYQRIIRYLKGLLSNRDRHELEKEIMQDAFEEEAFEGLNLLSASELESDMQNMEAMLDRRTEKRSRKIVPVLFRIAAAFLLLIGIGTVLYFTVFKGTVTPDSGYIAESKEVDTQPEERGVQVPAGEGAEVPVRQASPSVPTVLPDERPLDEASRQPVQAVPERKATAGAVTEVLEDEVNDSRLAQQYDIAVEVPGQGIRLRATAAAREEDTERLAESVPDQDLTSMESLTARVVDQGGNPVSGVAVYEKGTIRGAVTDMNGVFSMGMTQTSSLFSFSSFTFRESGLLPGQQVSGMARQEDETLSLKEVVIAGGMNAKMTRVGDEPGIFPAFVSEDPERIVTLEISSPVPPAGSLRAYKRLVEERIDTEKLVTSIEQIEDITGRYWIDVTLTILTDGYVGDILFETDIPSSVTDAYRASIQSLPSWQPALQGDIPVESEVEIRFMLSIE